MAVTGCNVSQATLEGHDIIDDGLANLQVGINEYAADDTERLAATRAKLAEGFASDVAAIAAEGGDANAVAAKTTRFIELLDQVESARQVEATRRQRMLDTIRALSEVNADMRVMTEIKLGWKDDAIQYTEKLQRKVVPNAGTDTTNSSN